MEKQRFSSVQLIENYDINAGFCALVTYALNGIRKSLEYERMPIVHFHNEVRNHFYDTDYGENVWDYYFEPVMGMSYREFKDRKSSLPVHRFSGDEVVYFHHHDPNRIATFWSHEEPESKAMWMEKKRKLGREYVARHIRVKPHIRTKAQHFYRQHIAAQYTIGVHIRGSDFAYAAPTGPDTYFQAIDIHVTDNQVNDYKIFLATDQRQFVDLFRRRFGDRLLCCDCLRSDGAVPPFRMQTRSSPYFRGEEVLIDILLMAKCDYLFKGAAAGAEYAMWFGKDLRCTDFALQSHFEKQSFLFLQSAYVKLNLGKRNRTISSIQQILRNLFEHKILYLLGSARRFIRRLFKWLTDLIADSS